MVSSVQAGSAACSTASVFIIARRSGDTCLGPRVNPPAEASGWVYFKQGNGEQIAVIMCNRGGGGMAGGEEGKEESCKNRFLQEGGFRLREGHGLCVCARVRVIQFLKVNAGIRIVGIPPEIMFLNCACACVCSIHALLCKCVFSCKLFGIVLFL